MLLLIVLALVSALFFGYLLMLLAKKLGRKWVIISIVLAWTGISLWNVMSEIREQSAWDASHAPTPKPTWHVSHKLSIGILENVHHDSGTFWLRPESGERLNFFGSIPRIPEGALVKVSYSERENGVRTSSRVTLLSLPTPVPVENPQIPTYAATCAAVAEMQLAEQRWCDEAIPILRSFGYLDAAGRTQPTAKLCLPWMRERFIAAIWKEKVSDVTIAKFLSGVFVDLGRECFEHLSATGSPRSAWRWRAAAGVMISYSDLWIEKQPVDTDGLLQSANILRDALQHSDFLPVSDVAVVRERLDVVEAVMSSGKY